MPSTADHRVRCHQIATGLRRQGKPTWTATLRLGDLFHNEDLTFEAKRDGIVARTRRLPQVTQAQDVIDNHPESDDYYNAEDLINILEELADTKDVPEFDGVFSAFYDWADIARVWVETNASTVALLDAASED